MQIYPHPPMSAGVEEIEEFVTKTNTWVSSHQSGTSYRNSMKSWVIRIYGREFVSGESLSAHRSLESSYRPAGRRRLQPPHCADRTGFAGWYNQVNKVLKDLIGSLPTNPRVGNSWGFELYYNFAINKWLHLTADLQLTQSANKDDNFAVIPGGRLVLDF